MEEHLDSAASRMAPVGSDVFGAVIKKTENENETMSSGADSAPWSKRQKKTQIEKQGMLLYVTFPARS